MTSPLTKADRKRRDITLRLTCAEQTALVESRRLVKASIDSYAALVTAMANRVSKTRKDRK